VSTLVAQTAAALAADGALAQAIPGFVARPAQQRMATAVAEAITAREPLIAEAGTGTGKTFAYLVPALLSGLRVIVSTGTKALQDQLYHRDLPRVREALGRPLRAALLKGRANYVCLHRLDQAGRQGELTSREQVAELERIRTWAKRTRRGDLAEVSSLPEDSPLRPLVTSTTDNCLGSECPFWNDCFVVKARAEAQAADLVVVNHHLLLADLAIREEGFGEILPGASAFILDEAHQLPDLASQFFGDTVSSRMLQDLARDVQLACASTTGALAALAPPARALEARLRSLRVALDTLPPRGVVGLWLAQPAIVAELDGLQEALAALDAALGPFVEAAPEFAAARLRLTTVVERLQQWQGDDAARRAAQTAGDDDHEPDPDRLPPSPEAQVRWYELTPRGFSIAITPLDVAAPLRRYREQSRAAWIFTSATLAVGGDVGHIARKLGLYDPQTLVEESPFDWPNQALCYQPPNLPDPGDREYTLQVLRAAWPVLKASNGRAFLLFTSHRALREAAEKLQAGPWPLFVQGTAPRHELLERFRASGNGVLLGAASFWEGVDVAGDALSVVLIDKLPFAAPDDPVLEARLEAVRRRGGNPFVAEQIPQAAIALKQGVGRLIRTHADRGVLVLCDPRLISKPYGRLFLASLPPFRRTRSVADVQAFFAEPAVLEPSP
jgi:ATP-dependent DNA helicase DinG